MHTELKKKQDDMAITPLLFFIHYLQTQSILVGHHYVLHCRKKEIVKFLGHNVLNPHINRKFCQCKKDRIQK